MQSPSYKASSKFRRTISAATPSIAYYRRCSSAVSRSRRAIPGRLYDNSSCVSLADLNTQQALQSLRSARYEHISVVSQTLSEIESLTHRNYELEAELCRQEHSKLAELDEEIMGLQAQLGEQTETMQKNADIIRQLNYRLSKANGSAGAQEKSTQTWRYLTTPRHVTQQLKEITVAQ